MIGAILRAQLLSMRLGRGRGWVRFIPYTVWYLFWLGASVFAFVLMQLVDTPELSKYLPLAFLGICLYWQLMPLLSASMGAGLDLRKLLIYPVPHERLYFVEVMLRVTTAFEMLLVMGGVLSGFLFNRRIGGIAAFPRAAAAVLLLIAFNLMLSSGTRSLLERLLNKRKIREVVVLFTMCLWMVPRLLMQLNIRPKWLGPAADLLRGSGFPWSASATFFVGSRVLVPFVALCVWTFFAYWFGRSQFERNLRFDVSAAQARTIRPDTSRGRSITDFLFRLPGTLWRDPLGGLVEKELRSLARTPRFRMVFIMGFTFGVVVWLPMAIGRGASKTGFMNHYFLVFVCLYALTLIGQVTYWNCFGFDRSAVTFYFAAPQPMRLVLVAKNLAAMSYVLVDMLIVMGVVGALRLIDGWQQAIETLVVVATCSLYLLAVGNMASVNYPRAINPERVSQGGGSGKVQGMLILFYPLALLPVVLAYLARYAFDSQMAFDAVMVLAAGIGGAVYWIGLSSAVDSAGRKREMMMQELSKSDGPIVGE